jgi:hypothetical protein
MRFVVVALVFSLAGSHASAACAPDKMVRLVTRNVTPGVDPASFAGQPLVMHRQGTRKLRTEEAPDPSQGLHLLIVMDSPDVWFVNRADKTGRHIVDPGPTFDVHAPIINLQGLPEELAALEYGCEAEYLRQRGSTPAREVTVAGVKAAVHQVESGPHQVELTMTQAGRPLTISYSQAGRLLFAIAYDRYEPGLPLDATLFTRPESVTYTEERPAR